MFLLRSVFQVYIYGVTLSLRAVLPTPCDVRFVRGQAVLSGLALLEIRTANSVADSMAFAIGGGYLSTGTGQKGGNEENDVGKLHGR